MCDLVRFLFKLIARIQTLRICRRLKPHSMSSQCYACTDPGSIAQSHAYFWHPEASGIYMHTSCLLDFAAWYETQTNLRDILHAWACLHKMPIRKGRRRPMMSLVIRVGLGGHEVPLKMSDTTSVLEFRQAVKDATASVCDSPFDLTHAGSEGHAPGSEGHAPLGNVFGVDDMIILGSKCKKSRKERRTQIKENDEIMEKTLSKVGVRNHDVITMIIRADTPPPLVDSSADSSSLSAIDDIETSS